MKTLENLVKAFIGECVARNRYTFYAKIAKKEGYVFVSKVFLETAENEKEHAENLYKAIQELRDGDVFSVNVEIPIALGNTRDVLKIAIEGESYEHNKMYPEFAKVAEEEGFDDISKMLNAISIAEKHHEDRYRKILSVIENGTMFKRDKEVEWVCLECGYVHHGYEPPEKCPSCKHDRGYYVSRDLLSL
ncbi:rubrerythrin [Methanocaldococcus villosus KIN24-T80]|uniref:Rubrerythrin n=1 Tax=Methanocaldococcus villosus KIN24-T80 TaxID=1069083 RepID=N6V1I0_9EURY|nr:rubrerythrin family protein [Methanocaldococcus villosus]ENN96128.1 rubrerythrin [Methanocaldococcus villosus KIN24-T80]